MEEVSFLVMSRNLACSLASRVETSSQHGLRQSVLPNFDRQSLQQQFSRQALEGESLKG